MSISSNRKNLIWSLCTGIGAWGLYFVILYLTCRYALVYRESIGTWYGDPLFVGRLGWMQALTLWLAQYFISPIGASLIASGVLAVSAALISVAFYRFASTRWTVLLALLPGLWLALQHPDIKFQYAWDLILLIVSLACCIVALLAAKRKENASRTSAKAIVFVMLIAVVGAWLAWDNRKVSDKESFYELSYYARHQQWARILGRVASLDPENLVYQNFRTLALARQGRLCESLFEQPIHGPASLFNTGEVSPDMFMLLSDIYYAMGHVSLAQRYAFEANVAYDDYSPRLLQRLVDTSLAYGNYPVAEKYLRLLETSRHYKGWAAKRQALLYDDEAVASDPELGPMCRNVFSDDRFAGIRGIDDDLLQIVRGNPDNAMAIQYLCAIHLLTKQVPRLVDVVEEFAGTAVLAMPLPRHIQEALAVASYATGQDLDRKYQLAPAVMYNCKSFWNNNQSMPNTFWQYQKYNK